MLNLEDFKPKSKPPFEMEEADFVDPTSLIGTKILIRNVEYFENQKGPGMYILFNYENDATDHYTTTHAGGIIRILNNEDLRILLKEGNILPATINRRSSKNDASKTVWELI